MDDAVMLDGDELLTETLPVGKAAYILLLHLYTMESICG
jgi:hypothetical protein